MTGTILVGTGRELQRVPDDAFVQSVERLPARMASRLAAATEAAFTATHRKGYWPGRAESFYNPFRSGETFVLSCAQLEWTCKLGLPRDDFSYAP